MKIDEEFERQQLESIFPKECEQIPIDKLKYTEALVVIKCMNHQELTVEEFTLLKKVLVRYRKAIKKVKPKETLKAVNNLQEQIRNETELINLLNNDKTLKVNIPINNKTYPVTFTVLPVEDSRVLQSLEFHINLFKKLSNKEKKIIDKAKNKPESLTNKETEVLAELNKKIEQSGMDDFKETVVNFLSNQLIIENSNCDINTRKQLWNAMPFSIRTAIYYRVLDILGLSDKSNEELFPDG